MCNGCVTHHENNAIFAIEKSASYVLSVGYAGLCPTRLGVAVRTTRRLINADEIRAHRIGWQWRVFEADMQDYLDREANRPCRHRGIGGRAA